MATVAELRSGNTSGKALSPVANFSNFLDKFKPQMALALPKHLNADRLARIALSEFSKSPQLQSCEHISIIKSLMDAAALGLEVGVNGHGFLVPYGKSCTFIPGWKGLVDLVNRSGRGTVFTGVIFRDQEYRFTDGAKRDLVILNETELDDPEDITHAFAIGWVKNSDIPVVELWRVSKIKKHRDKYNKMGGKHYSFRHWEAYCRKVVLLHVLDYMPCSVEINNLIDATKAIDEGKNFTFDGVFVTVDDAETVQETVVNPEPVKATRKPKQSAEPTETVDTETGEITQVRGEPVQVDSSQEEWGEFE